MVWAAVTENGRSPLIFLPPNTKINADVYQELILNGALLPWTRKHFENQPFTFQQDSAPAHKARKNQEWLQNSIPKFISSQQWPPNSPDLNPLDYSIWGILQAKACKKKHISLDSLKKDLTRKWNRLSDDVIRASCISFKKRLQLVVKAKGGYMPSE